MTPSNPMYKHDVLGLDFFVDVDYHSANAIRAC